ncbi:MAG TPA: hypothetical protein PKE69_27850 [Pyrinomonadaceae bacterium]|nr:hypothetical protein [Pyrinomonadaceae bacterium]
MKRFLFIALFLFAAQDVNSQGRLPSPPAPTYTAVHQKAITQLGDTITVEILDAGVANREASMTKDDCECVTISDYIAGACAFILFSRLIAYLIFYI